MGAARAVKSRRRRSSTATPSENCAGTGLTGLRSLAGIDPTTVRRALIAGNTADATVSINGDARALVLFASGRIADVDIALSVADDVIVTVIPDIRVDEPFAFFDVDLGVLKFDYHPRRDAAERDVVAALQFLAACRVLAGRGGFDAVCENMFAATELATMAMMKLAGTEGWGHSTRTEWLIAEGAWYGLTPEQAQVLAELRAARNDYRYGDAVPDMTVVELLSRLPSVEAVVSAARRAVEHARAGKGKDTP